MAILPLCVGLVREHWPRERVPVAIGVLTATYSIGAGIGFIIGGVFFWFSAALALLTLVLAVWLVPASPRATRTGRTDVVGGVMFVPAVGVVGLTQAASWGWASARTWGLIGAGVLLLFAWARHELRLSDPLIDVRLLGTRQIALANLGYFYAGF